MIPDPTELLASSGIGKPLIGFYDVPDKEPFAPVSILRRCLFSACGEWLKGKSICISEEDPDYSIACHGGGYWIGSLDEHSFMYKHFLSGRQMLPVGLNK
jgi:hypothetical protein